MPIEEISDKISFDSRIDIEMLLCMFALTKWKCQMDQIDNKSLIVEGDFRETLSAMYQKIPSYLKGELQYFFGDFEVVAGYTCYEFRQEHIRSIPEMIENIRNQDDAILLSKIVGFYMYSNVFDEQVFFDIYKIQNDIDAMLDEVKKKDVQNKNLQEKIVEILEHHTEIKERFCMLLSDFNEKIFEPQKEKITNYLTEGKKRYQDLFYHDPRYFIEFYMKIPVDSIKQKHVIHVSYFLFLCNLICDDPVGLKNTYVIIGIFDDINMAYEKDKQKQKIQTLYKILSDKMRFEIIRALSERPHYNQELAEKFGISPSTVNHHINSMYNLDIIAYRKIEHRVYYELKKDVLKNLLDLSSKMILGKV